MSNSISLFLERKLKAFTDGKFVKVTNAESYMSRVRDAIARSNSLKKRVCVFLDNKDISDEIFDKVKTETPAVFKNAKPTIYTSEASENNLGKCKSFSIEVI